MGAHDFQDVASNVRHRQRPGFVQLIQHPHLSEGADPTKIKIAGTFYYPAKPIDDSEMLKGGCVRMKFVDDDGDSFSVWFRQAPDGYCDIWASCDSGAEVEFLDDQEHYEIVFSDELRGPASMFYARKIETVDDFAKKILADPESGPKESPSVKDDISLADETKARQVDNLIHSLSQKVAEAFGNDEVVRLFELSGVTTDEDVDDDGWILPGEK